MTTEIYEAAVEYSLILPENFDDYGWEVESKGYFSEAKLAFAGKLYPLHFYDAGRLSQEIESELQRGSAFFEPNLIVLHSVTRENMNKSIEALVSSGAVNLLVSE